MRTIVRSYVVSVALIAPWALLSSGCGSEDAGAPPAIANMTYAPSTIPVGTPTTITGSLDFDDPDADAREIAMNLVDAAGTRQSVGAVDVAAARGRTSGTLAFALFVQPLISGAITLEVFLIDDQGNQSNVLTGTLSTDP